MKWLKSNNATPTDLKQLPLVALTQWLKTKNTIPNNPATYPFGDPNRQLSTDDVRPKTDDAPTSEGQSTGTGQTRLPGAGLVDEAVDPIYKKYFGKPGTDYTAESKPSCSSEEI